MKKLIILLIFCILCSTTFTSCTFPDNETIEHPQRYYREIDVKIVDISKSTYFAVVRRYNIDVTVYSKEYDLTFTQTFVGSGYFAPQQWNWQIGDTVKAELTIWKMESTGDIVKQSIVKIY